MNPNCYYPPPTSSGAAQGAYSQSTTSAGSGSALSAPAGGALQQQENQEPRMVQTIDGYSDDCVEALLRLKNDPRKFQWQYIYDELRKEFPNESSLPALNKGMLQKAFGRMKPALRAPPASQQGASTAVPGAPVGGSYGTSQAGYDTTHATSLSHPGSSYGASQSNPGGAFGGLQSDPWAQHAPTQLGSGGPYASTPNTNPQLPPLASFDPEWRQSCGYGGQYVSAPNTNQDLPPVESFALEWNQGHVYGGSLAMTSDPEGASGFGQAEVIGSNDPFVHRSPLDAFSWEQQRWIWRRGLSICPGYGWTQIEQDYLEEVDENGPDHAHLKAAFDEMRNRRW